MRINDKSIDPMPLVLSKETVNYFRVEKRTELTRRPCDEGKIVAGSNRPGYNFTCLSWPLSAVRRIAGEVFITAVWWLQRDSDQGVKNAISKTGFLHKSDARIVVKKGGILGFRYRTYVRKRVKSKNNLMRISIVKLIGLTK